MASTYDDTAVWGFFINAHMLEAGSHVFVFDITLTDIFVRVSGGETPPFRPPIPRNDTTNDVQLIELMRDCWDEFPTLRPEFSTIRNRFYLINKGK